MAKQTHDLLKRLTPLYIAAFFQSFVLWYAVEKLFMQSIGFDNTGIGVMIAVYSTVMLLVETPSGILADRWSRKGVLILASIALAISSLLGGISEGIWLYLVCAITWGIFFALYSGTYDSIVYDTVYEETGTSNMFEKIYGRVKVIESIALVTSSILGGIIANFMDLRSVYMIAVPLAVVAILPLLIFREPKLHKSEVYQPIKEHITETFNAILKNRNLLAVLSVLVLTSTLLYMLYEFSQLWLIALSVPTLFFGVANALLLTSIGTGGFMASWITARKHIVSIMFIILLLSIVGMIFLRNTFAVVFAQVLLGTVLTGLTVVFQRLLHDELSPKIRAGAASAVSTISRLVIIPLALLFGYISSIWSVFNASWLLFGIALLIVLVVYARSRKNNLL
ncbi:MAG: MFS transporter [Patescibacteria group bacterium]